MSYQKLQQQEPTMFQQQQQPLQYQQNAAALAAQFPNQGMVIGIPVQIELQDNPHQGYNYPPEQTQYQQQQQYQQILNSQPIQVQQYPIQQNNNVYPAGSSQNQYYPQMNQQSFQPNPQLLQYPNQVSSGIPYVNLQQQFPGYQNTNPQQQQQQQYGMNRYPLIGNNQVGFQSPLAPPAQAPLESVKEPEYLVHEVKSTDTLLGLSIQYGVPEYRIRQANDLHNDEIYFKKVLKIPNPKCNITSNIVIDPVQAQQDQTIFFFKTKVLRGKDQSTKLARIYLEAADWDIKQAEEDYKEDMDIEEKQSKTQKKKYF